MNNCRYYDDVLDCCKLFSDWSQPMPILQSCYEERCPKYKPIKEREGE